MCILCVIQKWSRRVATMLPWLVIPLIGLWALSQLLPPAFRFEITSPRLACVFVLLVTLFWYEILMPHLSIWRVQRNARLRERKRFEIIEMQKLRKTATRRCRNCLTPYRDQNPGGGKFMCAYCGHISKRPVLDLPVLPGLSNSGILKDLVGKGGKIFNGKVGAENSWMCSPDWLENGNWVAGPFSGKSGYWKSNGGGIFGSDDHCMADKSYSGVVILACKTLTTFFLGIGWMWRKIARVGSSEDDASSNSEHKGILAKRGENGVSYQESRGEKARRKAEEKRQARIERELLEEEERKQREEVARLVEERRRLRDEMIEAEKDRDRGSAIAREKDRRKVAEKKRQGRRKEIDKGSSKSNSDAEELEKRVGKGSDGKRDFDKRSETGRWEPHKSGAESSKAHSTDLGHVFKGATVNNNFRGNAGSRYLDHMKGTLLSSRAFSGSSFFGKGPNTFGNISRENKPNGSIDHVQNFGTGKDIAKPAVIPGKSNMGDERSINRPVLVEPQPPTIPKKSWQQLFTRSAAPSNSNVISRPNGKVQAEVRSPPSHGDSSLTQPYDNPLNFGFPSPFTLPTCTYLSTSSSTVIPLASEAVFPRIGEAPRELLPEESDIFEDPCYVPDPVSLLGPVSESLDNFQLDLGTSFVTDIGLEKPHALKNISTSSEVNRPSPIESPMTRSRVSDERHSSSNRFPGIPKAQDKQNSSMDFSNADESRTWQMWNTSPLGQDGLGLIGGPGNWFLPPELNRLNREDVVHPIAPPKTMASLFSRDDKPVSCTHSPHSGFLGNCQNGGTFHTPVPASGDDPWLSKTSFGPMTGSENHFSRNISEETSQKNELIYESPRGSASNHPFELSPADSWAKEWAVQGSGEGIGKSSSTRPHGGLYSPPDVQLLWSYN